MTQHWIKILMKSDSANEAVLPQLTCHDFYESYILYLLFLLTIFPNQSTIVSTRTFGSIQYRFIMSGGGTGPLKPRQPFF